MGLLGLLGLLMGAICASSIPGIAVASPTKADWASSVPRWGMQEIVLTSPRAYANPFKDVTLQAQFRSGKQAITVPGFYDGDGIWRIRFMPQSEGLWSFRTISNDPVLGGARGQFIAGPPAAGDHGPVHVARTYHFSHADGTPYFLLGTTAYDWINRDPKLQDETIEALRKSGFNKIRMGLFPKWFDFNKGSPQVFPFVRTAPDRFDLDRFDIAYFRNLERRIRQLQAMGIQADIILFHPYDNSDRWGFSRMSPDHDEAYLRYVTARLSAFSNVWWTMANEFELMPPNSLEAMFGQHVPAQVEAAVPKDWDRLARVVQSCDPYGHPLGIHNWAKWYDHSRPWITHAIIQAGGESAPRSARIARDRYAKPVVIDEYGYEGNNARGWGGLSAAEVVNGHWEIVMAGGYASHGETYVHPGRVAWAAGGSLSGDSPPRLAFLKHVMTGLPFQDMAPARELVVGGTALAKPGEAYLFRFPWVRQTGAAGLFASQIRLSGASLFKVELIDPWLMQIYPLGFTGPGDQRLTVPVLPSLLRVTAARPGEGRVMSVQKMLADFAGDEIAEEKADPTLFKDDSLYYSLNFPVVQILQNSEATAALTRFVPKSELTGLATVFPVATLVRTRKLSPDQVSELEKALASVRVR